MTEICWSWCNRVAGKRWTLKSTINHGKSVQERHNIYTYGAARVNRGSLRKVYGEPSDTQTEGMTMEELADRLEEIMAGEEVYLAEWSNDLCDYKLLLDSSKRIGRANIMPPIRNAFSILHAWRFACTGVPLVFELSMMHGLVMTFDFHLPPKAHRAQPDVLMAANMMDAYFKGALNPQASSDILRYFKAFSNHVVQEDDDTGDFLLLEKPKDPRIWGQTKEVPGVKSDVNDDWSDGENVNQSDSDDLDDPDSADSDIEGSDGPDSDGPESESNEDGDDTEPITVSRTLPTDKGEGLSHRLVDNNASDGDSISLAIAALTCGIAQQGFMMNVASDILQQRARFEDYNRDSTCLTEPDRFLIPVSLSKKVGNCGSEDYDEQVPEPTVSPIQSERSDKQHWRINTFSGSNASEMPPKPQGSSKVEEALQQKWVGELAIFCLS